MVYDCDSWAVELLQGSIELKIMDQSDVPEAVRRHISDTLNTTPTLTAFQKPSSNRNHRGFGYTEFVPLNTINSPQYVKNDVLFVRAIVREANRWWLMWKLCTTANQAVLSLPSLTLMRLML